MQRQRFGHAGERRHRPGRGLPPAVQSMFASDQTTPTVAIGLRSTRQASFSACQRDSGSAVRSWRRSSCLAPRWCHHGWMPPPSR